MFSTMDINICTHIYVHAHFASMHLRHIVQSSIKFKVKPPNEIPKTKIKARILFIFKGVIQTLSLIVLY